MATSDSAQHPPHGSPTGPISEWIAASGAVGLVRERSNQLFLVYTGARQRLMGDPALFLGQAQLLERNLVMFRDLHQAYYHRGVSQEIDTFEKFLAWQRMLCERLSHVERVFCIGTSMGGYAAILYGYYLRVEAVWAFSPQTDISTFPSPSVAPHLRDLSQVLTRSNGRTRYHIYYHRQSHFDEVEATRLQGADGVTLHPMDGTGHKVVETLIQSGSLPSLFPGPS